MNERKPKEMICAGEVLFDLISVDAGKSLAESTQFKKRMGGSPFNVCCGLARLGEQCSFFTQIGDDSFGKAVGAYLKDHHIDTKNTFIKDGANTSLAFAGVDRFGRADYEFYRDHTADVTIGLDKVDRVDLSDCSIFHFGSLAIVDEPGAQTYLKLFERAFSYPLLKSFDPNVRPFYIHNREHYINQVLDIIRSVEVLKLSDEDLYYISGENDPAKALNSLPVNPQRMEFVTLGENGCLIHLGQRTKRIEGYRVDVTDTVGCGDAFMAGVLKVINQASAFDGHDPFALMEKAARFAVACSAIVAMRDGAADSMPTEKEVNAFIAEREK